MSYLDGHCNHFNLPSDMLATLLWQTIKRRGYSMCHAEQTRQSSRPGPQALHFQFHESLPHDCAHIRSATGMPLSGLHWRAREWASHLGPGPSAFPSRSCAPPPAPLHSRPAGQGGPRIVVLFLFADLCHCVQYIKNTSHSGLAQCCLASALV